MQLKKSEPKLVASFIFPSDQNIDWRETQKALLDLPEYKEVKASFDNQPEMLEAFLELGNRDNKIYDVYVSKNYNEDILKGSPVVLNFDTLNLEDLNILTKNHKTLSKLISAFNSNKTELNDIINNVLADSELSQKTKELLKSILDSKMQSFENTEYSKEELIEAIIEQANPADLKELIKFLVSLNKNNVAKKKTLKPSVV